MSISPAVCNGADFVNKLPVHAFALVSDDFQLNVRKANDLGIRK